MSDAFFQVGLTEQSLQTIALWQQAPGKVAEAITTGLRKFLILVENDLKSEDLRDGAMATAASPRGGNLPLAARSGRLIQSIVHELTSQFEGWVGTSQGPASAYARAQLGSGETVVRPVRAKHLWVPIADNAPPKRKIPMSPREVMEKKLPNGQRAAIIFRSKAGNLVVFLREGGTYQKGKKKGQYKGRLMFVLKDQITIKGTDALAKRFATRSDEAARIMNEELSKVFPTAA